MEEGCDRTHKTDPSDCIILCSTWSSCLTASAQTATTDVECLGTDDKTIILWRWKTGKILHTLICHCWSIVAVTFGLNGEILVSGSANKMIKLWQVLTGQEIATLMGHSDSGTSVAINPKKQMMPSPSKKKVIKLWHSLGRHHLS